MKGGFFSGDSIDVALYRGLHFDGICLEYLHLQGACDYSTFSGASVTLSNRTCSFPRHMATKHVYDSEQHHWFSSVRRFTCLHIAGAKLRSRINIS
jgi:hypothetical protein